MKGVVADVTADRTLRFKENRIVSMLLDFATSRGLGLNEIWEAHRKGEFTMAELKQLYKLIGYSHIGFAEVFGGR
jgi:hypothetical protein